MISYYAIEAEANEIIGGGNLLVKRLLRRTKIVGIKILRFCIVTSKLLIYFADVNNLTILIDIIFDSFESLTYTKILVGDFFSVVECLYIEEI